MTDVQRCKKIVEHLYAMGLSKRFATKIMNLVIDKLEID